MIDRDKLIIKLALEEDLEQIGDLTSRYFVPKSAKGRGRIFVKEKAVILSGLEVAQHVFAEVDPKLQVDLEARDGDKLSKGQTVLSVRGSLGSILTAERTALNFIQQLSGIATLTNQFVQKIADSKAKILDTRKTTPGWRNLEKTAVSHGGGTNHRIGLFDAVMVKDNHLLAKSDPVWIQRAIRKVRKEHPEIKIELEVDRLDQLTAYLKLEGVDVILLDNMKPTILRKAVAMRNRDAPSVLLEASGGVNLETVAGIAETEVDFISVGALTHSARAVDFSLELDLES